MVRLTVLTRIKRMMDSYKQTKLKTFDRRLIRGLFIRNLKDFDEDYSEMLANKSLLARLKGAMHMPPSPLDMAE